MDITHTINANSFKDVKLKRNYTKCALCFVFFKICWTHVHFWDHWYPCFRLWWCLLWVSKPEWAALFVLDRGVHEIHLLFISSMRTLKKLLHCVQWLTIRRSMGVDPWGLGTVFPLRSTSQFSKRLTVNKCTVCLFKRKLQETDYWLLIWDSYSESDLDLLSRLLKYFVLSLVKSVNKSEKMENTYCCDSNWNWNKESK